MDAGYTLQLNGETGAEKLVIASGGLSRRGWARRRLAARPPNKLGPEGPPDPKLSSCPSLALPLLSNCKPSGVSVPSVITAEDGTIFRENLLSPTVVFPARQYCKFPATGSQEFVTINLVPDCDLASFLDEQRAAHPNQSLKNTLATAAEAAGGVPATAGTNSRCIAEAAQQSRGSAGAG